MKKLTDEELIAELERGRPAALDEIYARYSRSLFAFCRHAAHNPPSQEVEDLVQDVFLRVIKAAHTFNPNKASFRTWLYRIARNRCIDFHRRKPKGIILSIDGDDYNGNDSAAPGLDQSLQDPDENTESRVIQNAIQQAISDCIAEVEDGEERQALLLYYLAGKVYREIAYILGKSLSTAKNRVNQAQQKVKVCLEIKGIESW